MNSNYIKIIALVILVFLGANSSAQETVTIPLTQPKEKGFLKIGIINGSISIQGYKGDEVIVKGIKRVGKSRRKSRSKNGRNGLKRITNSSLEFSAEEYDNTVHVRSVPQGTTDFEIQVPENFSLKVSTINRGDVFIENINGTIDVSNTNGKITLKDIKGSVSADALNKDIIVNFLKVTPNVPMAFSSLNGDIDVTFPSTFKADVKVKSDRGEIFTDFDLKTKPSKANITKDANRKHNAYRVKVEKWIVGSINGGGPEVLFKNFNGDVIIRSK